MSEDTGRDALVCPTCGRSYDAGERFCESCSMPLVFARGAEESGLSQSRLRARKIKPQLTEGALVKVARASNQAEAEFIAGLLLEEGIPSLVRRAPRRRRARLPGGGRARRARPRIGASDRARSARPGT